MTLNGIMAVILRYLSEISSFHEALPKVYVYDVVVKSSRSLSHLLTSFLFTKENKG